MKTIIETISHKAQKYPTVGDWRNDPDGTLRIRVSDMKNEDYEFLIALHELVEQHLCKKRGITVEAVDEFDIEFEKQRAKSLSLSTAEPGDNRFAPYRNEHCIATGVERIVAAALGVNWSDYEVAINSL